jgi:hypothetical protein
MRLKNPGTRQQLRLGNERTTTTIYRKAIGLVIVKRAVGISSRLQRIRNWTLWRGQPPSKTEKETADRAGAGNI